MKDLYIERYSDDSSVPIFSQPWYLDIVCEGKWDVVVTYDGNEQIAMAWPYYRTTKFGFNLIQMPPYCPYLGPLILSETTGNTTYKQNGFYFRNVEELANLLPDFGYLNVNFNPDQRSWYPLFHLGYRQTTRYTYIIRHQLGLDQITAGLKPKLRNVLSKREKDVIQVDSGSRTELFLDLLENTLENNGVGQFFKRKILSNIIATSLEKGNGKLYLYKEGSAGVFTIEDDHKVYCLLTATNEEGRLEDGVSHLIWYAIEDAVTRKKDFDFEGSMLQGVEKFFRSFGGDQVPYHQVSKTNNPLLRFYKSLRP